MRETAVTASQAGGSSPIMESELLGYKKKVEQMTVLVKHYQNELESQKVRRDGVETVSRLLAESRQENVALRKSLVATETGLRNCQNRLVVNGLSCGEAADENEVIVPGTSKQTLTNLVIENKRLRSMLQRDAASESESMDNGSLQRPAEESDREQTLEQTIDQLKAEKKSMKMKLSDLETLFKSSNNEKDQQLIRLQDQLQQMQPNSGERSGSNKTVAGLPVPALKEQLRVFMSQCQDFEMQLDNMKVEVKEETAVELTPITKQAVERAESVDGVDVSQLLEDKQKLQDRVEEVTKMNQRWQEFYQERERHTQTLEQRVQELDERLKEAMRSGPTEEINRRIEQVMEKSRKMSEHEEEMRLKAEQDVDQLRQEVAARDAQIVQLQSQVTILSRHPPQPNSAEASSTIEHLKAQIQVCTEDFEKERQDRQVALQKVASLKEQMAQLQKVNCHLQSVVSGQTGQPQGSRSAAQEHGHHDQQPHTLQPRGAQHHHHHHHQAATLPHSAPRAPQTNIGQWRDYPDFDYDYESPNMDGGHHGPGPASFYGAGTELIARGGKSLYGADSEQSLYGAGTEQPLFGAETELIARGGKPLYGAGTEQPLSDCAVDAQAQACKQNVLTCPKCNKEFSEERQGELLAHMDVCWE